MAAKAFDPGSVIDLERYPIREAADGQRAALIERLRGELDSQQYCVLPGFITEAALAQVLKEVEGVKDSAFRNSSRRNCYLYKEPDAGLPEDHPRNLFFDASYSMIGNHLLPESSLLKALYNWPGMMAFVAEIVGVEKLYPNEDKYQPVNVNCFEQGDQSAWHFDSWNAFTMTLMLQAAEAGGEFEIAPNTRSDDDPMYDDLAKVLKGERARVVTVPREPRALVIFRGCNSIHRVTPVEGRRQRLMSVFVYEEEPGIEGDAKVNETVYGAPPAPSGKAPRGRMGL